MSDFWVHGVDTLGDDAAARLAERHPDWRFTDGATPPGEAAYGVLVSGRPGPELLAASPALHTLIISHAGIPADTAELLEDFKHLRVRTVHYNAGATAELALGLVIAAARALVPADQAVRRGDWTARFVPPALTMVLGGHPATVVGYGEIGRRVARSLVALGMEVHAIRASTTTPYDDDGVRVHPRGDLSELVGRSRVVLLAVPANPATTGMFDADLIARLPEPSVLVNVARAALVDEAALFERLRQGGIAAGLDVWWTEARSAEEATGVVASRFPYHELPNVVLSPHRGGFDLREVRDLRLTQIEQILVELSA